MYQWIPFLISSDHLVYTLEVTIPAPYPYTSQDLQNYKVRKLQITVVSRFPNTGVTSTYGRSVKATCELYFATKTWYYDDSNIYIYKTDKSLWTVLVSRVVNHDLQYLNFRNKNGISFSTNFLPFHYRNVT